MFELGQPLHAFDYDKVIDHHVIVRRAAEGEVLTTLDGVDRRLDSESLLIADPDGGIGLAGIMGGENSEVSESTVNIFLESANFNPQNNRRTAGLLGMRSEATLRFEKGLRAGLAEVGIKRCLRIIQEVAGGEIAPGLIDEWPGKGCEQEFVDLTREHIARVMGVEYPVELIETTLKSLGFEIEPLPDDGPDGWRVAIPYWRSDIAIPEDLVEELARIIGYDDLPATRRRRARPTLGTRCDTRLPPPRGRRIDRLRYAPDIHLRSNLRRTRRQSTSATAATIKRRCCRKVSN